MNEPELQADDLEERLKTTIRRAEVALLLIRYGFPNYLPTILEDMFAGTQTILDLYCVSQVSHKEISVTKNPKDDTQGTYNFTQNRWNSCGLSG